MMGESDATTHPNKKELLLGAGRLVRGLSAVFWSLPLVLLLEAHTDLYLRARALGIFLPVLANGIMLFGLIQMSRFQTGERVWRHALDRTIMVGWVNVGLTPFLYFWHVYPGVMFFSLSVSLLFVCGLVYLYHLNEVLRRLASMIPDHTLWHDTQLFTGMNRRTLSMVMVFALVYHGAQYLPRLSPMWAALLRQAEMVRPWLVVMMVVIPVAMTMSLLWKIKEILLDNLYSWAQEEKTTSTVEPSDPDGGPFKS